MQQHIKNLGKVSLTAEGVWKSNIRYDVLSVVYDEHTKHAFLSRKNVPENVSLYNAEYWMPLNVSGYVDNNMIILNEKISDTHIKSYNLEEAIKSITSVGRKPGTILAFYNENTDRLDIGGRWELWQFNSTTTSDWENSNCWNSIYYNYNKFVGWYKDEDLLKRYFNFPDVGCYAYVGNELNQATVYRCDIKYTWVNTLQPVWDYVQVIIKGTVTVGENGNWFNDGEDTGIPAIGPAGKTPMFEVHNNETIDVSFDGVHWKPLVSLNDITPTITVNKVNTLAAGSKASVKNVGNKYDAKFDFSIPMGNTGVKGEKGDGWQVDGWVDTVDLLPSTATIGTTYLVGTTTPYTKYVWKNNTSKWVEIGTVNEIKASIFDGGRADTLYGGAREINCGGADAYLT